MNFILTEDKFVKCQICGKELEKIDGRHLNRCSKISLNDYILKYGTPTITKEKYEKELISMEKRKLAKIESEGKTKIVKCYFCKVEFEVNYNCSNEFSICNECKGKGLVSPTAKKAQENLKKTMLEKYGVENASLLKSVNEKRIEKFKGKSEGEKREIVEKRKETTIQRFGEDFYTGKVKELREEGMMKKYDVKHALQVEGSVLKFKETISKRSKEDIDNTIMLIKETKNERYGNENYINIEKIKNTNMQKYGGIAPTCNKEVMEKSKNTTIKRMSIKMEEKLIEKNLKLLDEGYVDAYYSYSFRCLKCGHEFKQNWNTIQQDYSCPNCRVKTTGPSLAQLELQEFILSLGFQNVSFDNRVIIAPQELDIVIHDINIAIEYDGFWGHHYDYLLESRKNVIDVTKYHLNKTIDSAKKGYRLIHIFEDEWILKKDIVLSRLKQILKVNNSEVIYARKCIIKRIDSYDKNIFLEKYHIQGKDNAPISLGAFYEDKLISVMTFSKPNISKGGKTNNKIRFELNRFCSDSSYHIPGIAGKLLSYFKKNFEWDEIFSFCDLRWSDGNLYKKLGFTCTGSSEIGYWYWNPNKDIKRIHRFNLRKGHDDPKDIPEKKLRRQQGFKIIHDCGNLVFTMINNK